MKHLTKSLIILSSVVSLALCFCGNQTLHSNLAETVVQVSNSLKEYHYDVTRLEPHVTSSMIVALRLAGHLPHTILNEFKINDSHTILDYLKSHLDAHKISPHLSLGHIASIFQAISALCYDPQNFYSHNLANTLLEGVKKLPYSTYSNSFEYSSVALAACQSLGTKIKPHLAMKIHLEINKRRVTQSCMKRPDTIAMTLMALSCLRQNIAGENVDLFIGNVNKTIEQFLKVVRDALRKRKDSSWNAHSKGLLVQAITSLPKQLRPRHWHCNRLLSNILDKHDPSKGFGNILANIHILPALLGRSLLDLRTSCPTQAPNFEEVKRNKTVCVRLVIHDETQNQNTPEKVFLVVPEKATAYEILKQAEDGNSAYKFEVLKTSYGRMITRIASVEQNQDQGYYWALYESEKVLARDGVDLFIPKNNTCVIFKYERCAAESGVVDETNYGGSLA